MSTIYLTHTALVIEDCEDAWTDGTAGSVTCTADDTIEKVGTYCAKMAFQSGATSGAYAYETISSTNLSAYTHIVCWVRSSIALTVGQVEFLLDNTAVCDSPLEEIDIPALAANTWTRVCLPIVAPSSCTGIEAVGIQQTADLGAFDFYVDDVRAVKGNDYDAFSIRGIDDLDDITLFPDIQNQFLDGSASRQNVGFWRNITLDLGVLTTKSDRTFLRAFAFATDQELIYNGESIPVVFTGNLAANWVDNYQEARQYVLQLRDSTLQTTNPASWS